jgi:hypothetical protein
MLMVSDLLISQVLRSVEKPTGKPEGLPLCFSLLRLSTLCGAVQCPAAGGKPTGMSLLPMPLCSYLPLIATRFIATPCIALPCCAAGGKPTGQGWLPCPLCFSMRCLSMRCTALQCSAFIMHQKSRVCAYQVLI